MNGWVNEWTCWKWSVPALLSSACTFQWPIALPCKGGDSLTCVLAVGGLWFKYVRKTLSWYKSRNKSFYLPQNTESSPGDPCFWPGLKFPSLWSLKGQIAKLKNWISLESHGENVTLISLGSHRYCKNFTWGWTFSPLPAWLVEPFVNRYVKYKANALKAENPAASEERVVGRDLSSEADWTVEGRRLCLFR